MPKKKSAQTVVRGYNDKNTISTIRSGLWLKYRLAAVVFGIVIAVGVGGFIAYKLFFASAEVLLSTTDEFKSTTKSTQATRSYIDLAVLPIRFKNNDLPYYDMNKLSDYYLGSASTRGNILTNDGLAGWVHSNSYGSKQLRVKVLPTLTLSFLAISPEACQTWDKKIYEFLSEAKAYGAKTGAYDLNSFDQVQLIYRHNFIEACDGYTSNPDQLEFESKIIGLADVWGSAWDRSFVSYINTYMSRENQAKYGRADATKTALFHEFAHNLGVTNGVAHASAMVTNGSGAQCNFGATTNFAAAGCKFEEYADISDTLGYGRYFSRSTDQYFAAPLEMNAYHRIDAGFAPVSIGETLTTRRAITINLKPVNLLPAGGARYLRIPIKVVDPNDKIDVYLDSVQKYYFLEYRINTTDRAFDKNFTDITGQGLQIRVAPEFGQSAWRGRTVLVDATPPTKALPKPASDPIVSDSTLKTWDNMFLPVGYTYNDTVNKWKITLNSLTNEKANITITPY